MTFSQQNFHYHFTWERSYVKIIYRSYHISFWKGLTSLHPWIVTCIKAWLLSKLTTLCYETINKKMLMGIFFPSDNNKLVNIYVVCCVPGFVPGKRSPCIFLLNLHRNPMGSFTPHPKSPSLWMEDPSFELHWLQELPHLFSTQCQQIQTAFEFH